MDTTSHVVPLINDYFTFLQKKINKNNAKEVAQNLTKVFKQSRPKDLSKDDADVAASIVEAIVSIKERLNEVNTVEIQVVEKKP